MRCDLVLTSAGRVLRDRTTRKIVFGPTWSYAALSRYLRENRIVIVVETRDESAPATKGRGT